MQHLAILVAPAFSVTPDKLRTPDGTISGVGNRSLYAIDLPNGMSDEAILGKINEYLVDRGINYIAEEVVHRDLTKLITLCRLEMIPLVVTPDGCYIRSGRRE